jgi:hypothetical protein
MAGMPKDSLGREVISGGTSKFELDFHKALEAAAGKRNDKRFDVQTAYGIYEFEPQGDVAFSDNG